MTNIIKGDRVPLYYQLMDIIIAQIDDGEYIEHDKLPSEREFCEIYDISRATVRQTIQELEKSGYIYKLHGKGTFVSAKKMEQNLLKFYSFTEEMKKLGKKPSSKVLDFEIININEGIASKMNMKKDDQVYKFTRLRLADENPIMIETSYIPANKFKGITKLDLDNKAMYDIFVDRFDINFTKAEEVFTPVATRENEAEYLEYEEGLPSMMIERITYATNDIIEYTIGIARGDKFNYRVVLEK